MKTIYLSFILLATTLATSAQKLTQKHPLKLGMSGGLNLSYLSIGTKGLPQKVLPGVNLGFTATYGLGRNFSLQSGVSFSAKGGKVAGKGPIGFDGFVMPEKDASFQSRQLYLQLPVYALYRIRLSSGKAIIVSAGPYVAQGIAGNTTLNGDLKYGDMITQDEMKEKTFSSRGLKKLDYGIGAGIGFDLGECTVGLTYELGLRDIGPEKPTYFPYYNGSYRNRNVAVSVAFSF